MKDQTTPLAGAIGTPGAYREFIADVLANAGAYANLGVTYAEIEDDAGMAYAIRCLVARTRTAVSILSDLEAMKAKQASRRATESPVQPSRPKTGEPADAL